MNAPVRRPVRDRKRAEAPLDPALRRIIEALAEAQARRDYARAASPPEPVPE